MCLYVFVAACILVSGCGKAALKIQSPLGKGIYQANLLYQDANYQECRRVLESLLPAYPDDPHLHYNLGLTYARLNLYSQARDEYLKALRQKGGNISQIHQGLGDLYRQQRLYTKAILEYQRALTLMPDSIEAMIHLAGTYEETGKIELAVKEYKSALRVKALPEIYLNLGNIHYKLRQYEEAISVYQKALRMDPNRVEVYNNLGLALERKGDSQEAAAWYQKAIRLDSRFLPPYINLGAFYRSAGKYDMAREQYLHALKLKPDCLDAVLNLGILYDLYLADPQEAIKNYRQYCQGGGPRSSEVKRWIENLQSGK
ncbi:MAG: tetratricopeptide repeat protein [bacterium]